MLRRSLSRLVSAGPEGGGGRGEKFWCFGVGFLGFCLSGGGFRGGGRGRGRSAPAPLLPANRSGSSPRPCETSGVGPCPRCGSSPEVAFAARAQTCLGFPPHKKKKTPKPGGGEFPVPGSVPPNPPGYRPGEVQGSCRGAARCFSTGFLSPNTLKKKNNPPPSRCHISYLEISFHRDLIAWPELCNYSYFFPPSSTASVVKPVF